MVDYEVEMQHMTKPMEMEVEQVQNIVATNNNSTSNQIKSYTGTPKRLTRSQTKGRGKLADILEAIEIEESPIVKPAEIKEEENKNKREKG